jgi:hypothetical protein
MGGLVGVLIYMSLERCSIFPCDRQPHVPCQSTSLSMAQPEFCGNGQVSPMMGACDQSTSHKRKVPSPFISYSTSSHGVVQLAPSSKRHAGGKDTKAGGAEESAEREVDKFSLLNPEAASGKEEEAVEEAHFGNGSGEQEASPTLSMISCGSMSAFALGVASGNGGRPMDASPSKCQKSPSGGIIDQAAATVDS